ncbi:MAG: AbrB/MazE/SpoVT family DNA-binding domain-containing protein [Candidatus Eremiobacteraeota bacterium]|nr:AbrB/MazE/SpoVT family DNA-binding domain-containing protein [Candidatus Eremiobacteraeota bacterium]
MEKSMPIVKTSSKGQLVIPGEIRKKLGIKPGQKVFLNVVDREKVEIYPIPENPVEAFCGIFEEGSSLTGMLREERRQEREIEKKMASGFVRPSRVSQKGRKLSKSK